MTPPRKETWEERRDRNRRADFWIGLVGYLFWASVVAWATRGG
jgi:hypothetical protein